MKQAREQELVEQLREGNVVAYQAILNYHLPALSRYVIRMVGNPDDAEEIIQDVFLCLWQKVKQFDQKKAKLTTWLHKIAHNKCIDYFRKNEPFMLNINDLQSKDHPELLSNDSPQHKLLRSQENGLLVKAIQQLPEGQRSALVLCHYQSLSNRQAAEVLSISVHALESLLSRSRKKLQFHLQSNFKEG